MAFPYIRSPQYSSLDLSGTFSGKSWVGMYTHPVRRLWRPSHGGQLTTLKICSRGQKLHMALMSDRRQSNGSDHLSNLCLNKCIYHLHLYRSLPHYIALTISTISRGGMKINVSCYVIKLDFFLPRLFPLLTMVSTHLHPAATTLCVRNTVQNFFYLHWLIGWLIDFFSFLIDRMVRRTTARWTTQTTLLWQTRSEWTLIRWRWCWATWATGLPTFSMTTGPGSATEARAARSAAEPAELVVSRSDGSTICG